MSGNRSLLPLHSLSIRDTAEDHSVSSLGTPESSDEDMDGGSSSSGGSRYDSTRLLRDIKEALDTSRYPDMQKSITDTQAIYRREYNKISKWNNDDFSLMNDKDEQLIEEQFKILQQIEQDKVLSKNTQGLSNKSSKEQDTTLVSAKAEKIGYSDPKLREWEGKIVKLLDEQHSQAAIATGDAFYIKCTGCSSTLGFPKESTHLYCPLCHTLHKLS